jgi:6-oxo-cyclohex-1-ene-carbonyl-CoA hydrolase
MTFKDHNLTAPIDRAGLHYEEVPFSAPGGEVVPGLHVVRITLDNPSQLNSYTTDMVKGVILGMRRASNDRGAGRVTGSGTRAFCTAAIRPNADARRQAGGIPPVCGSSTTW